MSHLANNMHGTDKATPENAKSIADTMGISLKAEIKTTVHVSYSDLQRLVHQVFGKKWEFACTQECDNDTTHEFTVCCTKEDTKYDWQLLTDDDRKDVDDWLFGDKKYPKNYSNGNILNRLCELKLIPPGEYIVSVSW